MEDKLWKISTEGITPPNIILEEQANDLYEATGGLLKGLIKTQTPSYISSNVIEKISPISKRKEVLECTFIISVPNINYVLQIMKVTFSLLEFYPLILEDFINDQIYEAKDKESFINLLRNIIPSDNMTKLINNLIVQARIKMNKD